MKSGVYGDELTAYDYASIMHYPSHAWSKNDQPTLVAKRSNVQMGVGTSLSPCDVEKVQLYYDCKAKVSQHYISHSMSRKYSCIMTVRLRLVIITSLSLRGESTAVL